jgi:myo-inositol-1(or 4)-monophosphatase
MPNERGGAREGRGAARSRATRTRSLLSSLGRALRGVGTGAPADEARPRPPIDGRTLTRLARRGGAIGLAQFRRVAAERSAAGTLVTEADREIERWLRTEMGGVAPEVAVIGEEFAATGDAAKGWALAVDPIDGTDAYVAGLPTWCVSLGLLHRGTPVAGVVYLPAFDDLYLAYGGTLRWNGTEVPRGGVEPQHDGFVLAYSEFHRRPLLRLRGKVRALGSTAYHLSLVARGAAEAAIVGRVHVWDVAAGKALLDAVGGELVYLRSGRPVELSALLDGAPTRDFMLAARTGATERVLQRIRRR